MMLRILAAAILLTVPAGPATAHFRSIQVEAVPVSLHPGDAGLRIVGGLRYRGGLALESKDKGFGGFSGLSLSPDGKRLIAVSDQGEWLTLRLSYDSNGDLAGIGAARMGALKGADGKPLKGKRRSDAESLAVDGEGRLIVGFERRHRLLRYDRPAARPEIQPPPGELHLAPDNGGIEAMSLLADGRMLLITEDFTTSGGVMGWIGAGGDWRRFTYATDGIYAPTGAATLPGGGVIVLERRYSLLSGEFRIRLRRLEGRAFQPDAVAKGRLVAELKPPLTTDNFEGIDARTGARGETLVMILSDDNFSRRQRTLLMMFELIP